MPLQPKTYPTLEINSTGFEMVDDPTGPVFKHSDQSIVYKVKNQKDELFALKVFSLAYRSPQIYHQAKKITNYKNLPGLKVCHRTVIKPIDHPELATKFPELRYAALMPWIPGKTWMELIRNQEELSDDQIWNTAQSLALCLWKMSDAGIAHCQLNADNLLINIQENAAASVELCDLEGLYAADLEEPEFLEVNQPEYSHPLLIEGIWNPNTDRVAGAILLSEILSWNIPQVRKALLAERSPKNGQTGIKEERFRLMVSSLNKHWGGVVGSLFEQAWRSKRIEDCPTFKDWAKALFGSELEKEISHPKFNDLENCLNENVFSEKELLTTSTEDNKIEMQQKTLSGDESNSGNVLYGNYKQRDFSSDSLNWIKISFLVLLSLITFWVLNQINVIDFAQVSPINTEATGKNTVANPQANNTATIAARRTATAGSKNNPTAIKTNEPSEVTNLSYVNNIAPHNIKFHLGMGGVSKDCDVLITQPSYSQEDIFYDEWFYISWRHNGSFASSKPTFSLIRADDDNSYIIHDAELNTDPDVDNCGWQGFSLEGIEPGNYMVEIKVEGKTYFRKNLNITYSDLSIIPRPQRPPFGNISFGRDGIVSNDCVVSAESLKISLEDINNDEWLYFSSPFQMDQIGHNISWKVKRQDGSIIYDVNERQISDNVDLCFWQGFSMIDEPMGIYELEVFMEGKRMELVTFEITE